MAFFTRDADNDINGITKSFVWLVVIVILGMWLLFGSIRSVGAGQVGIVTRFGEVNRTVDSGLALKLPAPFEKLTKMDIQVQKEQQTSSAATSDLQDVQATLALNYSLEGNRALEVYKKIGVDYKERVVTPAVQESFKAASAGYTAQELITQRAEVKGKAFEVIKTRLEKYGIRVVDLNITNFQFSAQFNAAIEAVQVANQNVAKARQELETTKVDAEKTVAEAQAQAEAQRLKQQTLTPELLQQEAIKAWDGKLPTYYGGTQGTFFNLPLQGN